MSWSLCTALTTAVTILTHHMGTGASPVVSPPSGATVNSYPTLFQCWVEENGTRIPIQWYLQSQLISTSLDPGIMYELMQENLTILKFDPIQLQPPTAELACGSIHSPGLFFANYTLRTAPLTDLINQTISQDTYVNISTELSSLALLSVNRTYLQTAEFLMDISTVFNGIFTFVGAFNNSINQVLLRNMVLVLDSLIQWQSDHLQVHTTSRIVKHFENVATLFAQEANFTAQFTDIIVATVQGTISLLTITGSKKDFTTEARVPASISLPPELFSQVPTDRPVIGVYFALYENPALLLTDMSAVIVDNVTVRETIVGSPIVAATVGPGINFGDIVPLDSPVVITLGLLPLPENSSIDLSSVRCVSWDFKNTSWITDGCTTEIVTNETFRCRCTRLTNLALLIDICSRSQDCVSSHDNNSYSWLLYIGAGIACTALLMTIVILLAFKKLREKDTTKYHVQLSIALFGVLATLPPVFIVPDTYGSCILVSVLNQYFGLASVMWMGAEALFIFRSLVCVFSIITSKFIIGVSIACWLLPLIPVLIPMIIDLANGTTPETDLIITRNVEVIEEFCFINNPAVLYSAMVTPLLTVTLLNVIALIWVTAILVRNYTKRNLGTDNQKTTTRASIQLVLSIAAIFLLFGIHWLYIGINLLFRPYTEIQINAFQAFFTISSVIQGLSFFFFFCVISKEARESWKEFFSCCSFKSHLSKHSSSQDPPNKITAVSSQLLNNRGHSEQLASNMADKNQQYSLEANGNHIFNSSPIIQNNTVEDIHTASTETQVNERREGTSNQTETHVNKVTVRRYSTMKHCHHVEEFEIAFEQQETDDESDHVCS